MSEPINDVDCRALVRRWKAGFRLEWLERVERINAERKTPNSLGSGDPDTARRNH